MCRHDTGTGWKIVAQKNVDYISEDISVDQMNSISIRIFSNKTNDIIKVRGKV